MYHFINNLLILKTFIVCPGGYDITILASGCNEVVWKGEKIGFIGLYVI
jgi:hypothetical protein